MSGLMAGERPGGTDRSPGWRAALAALGVLAAAAFLLAPGDLPTKAYVALHGLCAQRPAHTFALGGVPLPFDARMTGLYLGALIAGLPPLLGRRRGVELGWPWLALLAAFVVVMGMDGLNSLRVDLGLPAWWTPDNRLRLLTGLLAGLALGVGLAWLLNLGLWPDGGALLRPADLLIWLGAAAAALGLVLSGAGWGLVPLTLLLVAAAVLVVLCLNLAMLALMAGPPAGRGARLATVALAAAIVELGLLAGGRFALEATVGRLPL